MVEVFLGALVDVFLMTGAFVFVFVFVLVAVSVAVCVCFDLGRDFDVLFTVVAGASFAGIAEI